MENPTPTRLGMAMTDMEPTPAPALSEALSPTTLRAIEHCPLAAKFAREAKNPSSGPSTAGTIAHEICTQAMFQAHLLGKETFTAKEIEAIALRKLNRPEEANPLPREAMDEILAWVRKWAEMSYVPIKSEMFDVEHSVRREMGGQLFSGRIDYYAIDGSLAEVTDLKFGRVTLTEAEFAKDIQIKTYAVYLAEENPQIETVVCRQVYPRAGVTRELVMDYDDIQRHKRWLEITGRRVRAAWEAGEFPPVPGAWCKYCLKPEACPVPDWARPESIDSPEVAAEVAGAILVEEARLKKDKRALRSFLEQQYDELADGESGGVESGDVRAYLDVVETTRFSRKDAEADGLDLSPYDKPSTQRKLVVG